MTFFAKIREYFRAKKVKKEEIQSYQLPEPQNEPVAFLGFKERILGIFSWKKLSLNIQIYSRVGVVFVKKLPSAIFFFFRNLPKRVKKEGSRIKIHRKRFELKNFWPHLGISILCSMVIASTVFAQDMGFRSAGFVNELVEPSEFSDFALSADRFTPFINEKDNDMIITLAETKNVLASDEAYIIAPAEATTYITPKQSTAPSSRIGYIPYEVLGGETLSLIGAKFNVSSFSVLWANPEIKNPDVIQPGTKILIPPRDGMTVIVAKGQSLNSIVNKYTGNFDETLVANGITDAATIFAGQRILVANGRPPKATPTPAPKVAKSSGRVKGTLSSPTGPTVASGTFIWPTSGSVCQGYRRGHPAIDICAGGASPPITASDGGVVIQAAYGWNWGYGNTVLISHGNGFETRYAHLRVLNVQNGQRVSKGQLLGYMGTTGNSTGVHLHFEIHYGPAKLNPLAYLR